MSVFPPLVSTAPSAGTTWPGSRARVHPGIQARTVKQVLDNFFFFFKKVLLIEMAKSYVFWSIRLCSIFGFPFISNQPQFVNTGLFDNNSLASLSICIECINPSRGGFSFWPYGGRGLLGVGALENDYQCWRLKYKSFFACFGPISMSIKIIRDQTEPKINWDKNSVWSITKA